MMIYPPIAKLVEKTGNRYTLVLEAAKRARQLSEGAVPLTKHTSNKEVSIATDEIFEDKLNVFPAPGTDVIDAPVEESLPDDETEADAED